MRSRYPIHLEIAAPVAMFARPDTGAAPVSFPVPTWSAAKACFESVAALFGPDRPNAFVSPTSVEIWRPLRYERYKVNYRGPLRKPDQVASGTSYQLPATVLVDVCYRIHAECISLRPSAADTNPAHALKEIFERRLKRGQSKYTPCLGWRELLPSYFGPFREPRSDPDAPVLQGGLDLDVPAMLLSMWDAPIRGRYRPTFSNLKVVRGVLQYPQARVVDGLLQFDSEEKRHAG